MAYFTNKLIELEFDSAVKLVTDKLKEEGFGVLTEIDVQKTLKSKINTDFRRYKILGACNPPNAYKALNAEPHIGLLLPCNIVVQETEGNKIDISVINPIESMQAVNNPELESVAIEISARLQRVINSL